MSNSNAATAAQPTTTQAFNKPAAERRLGGVKATVWKQEPEGQQKYPTYQVRLDHDYYDKKTETWKPIHYGDGDENRLIISLRQWADQQMIELMAADRMAA